MQLAGQSLLRERPDLVALLPSAILWDGPSLRWRARSLAGKLEGWSHGEATSWAPFGVPVGPIAVLPIRCDGGFIYLGPPRAVERGKAERRSGKVRE